jgi:MoxR-like ATPase
LIRLQCFEGIDASEALYEWNYPRQLLSIRVAEAEGDAIEEASLFGRDYLIERPLLQAIEHSGPRPAVLLIDEVDRADEEFEAFLFEMLAENTVTVPEIGTIHAKQSPIVILTSNRTRDLHDALKRRCLYHWIDYPDLAHATAIVRARVPEAAESLATDIAEAVERIRGLDVQKPPGIAEAIDWVHAATLLGLRGLDEVGVERTLSSVLKYREDQDLARAEGLAWVAGQ